jgi:hypothetical protein
VKDLVEYLSKALVDRPDEVRVDEFEEDDGTIVFEVEVGEDEVGKLIGRNGRTINALRTVIRAAAVRHNRRVLVDVVD